MNVQFVLGTKKGRLDFVGPLPSGSSASIACTALLFLAPGITTHGGHLLFPRELSAVCRLHMADLHETRRCTCNPDDAMYAVTFDAGGHPLRRTSVCRHAVTSLTVRQSCTDKAHPAPLGARCTAKWSK
jgi:hypothetical protein